MMRSVVAVLALLLALTAVLALIGCSMSDNPCAGWFPPAASYGCPR